MIKIKQIHIAVTAETDDPLDTIAPKGLYLTDGFYEKLREAIKEAIANETADIDYPGELDEGPEEIGTTNTYHFLVG